MGDPLALDPLEVSIPMFFFLLDNNCRSISVQTGFTWPILYRINDLSIQIFGEKQWPTVGTFLGHNGSRTNRYSRLKESASIYLKSTGYRCWAGLRYSHHKTPKDCRFIFSDTGINHFCSLDIHKSISWITGDSVLIRFLGDAVI